MPDSIREGHLPGKNARFFRTVGEQNPDLSARMETNAQSFELVANWVEGGRNAEPPVDLDEG